MENHALVYAIGDLAKAAGVTPPTVRYYERIGLLPRPRRSAARQRLYGATDLERVAFIRRCRDLGFPIDTVRRLMALSAGPDNACAATRRIAADQLSAVQQRLSDLTTLERQLSQMVRRCDDGCGGSRTQACTIIGDIAGPPRCCAA